MKLVLLFFYPFPCVGAKLNQPKITDHLSQGKKSKELTNQDLHLNQAQTATSFQLYAWKVAHIF